MWRSPTPSPRPTLPEVAWALAALLLAGAAPPADGDLGARIAQARAAEQQFQGPLDGTWIVRTGRGRAILALQLVDPPAGRGPVGGAWRTLAGRAEAGVVDASRRGSRRVVLSLVDSPTGTMVLAMDRVGVGVWRGWMRLGGHQTRVAMRPGCAWRGRR